MLRSSTGTYKQLFSWRVRTIIWRYNFDLWAAKTDFVGWSIEYGWRTVAGYQQHQLQWMLAAKIVASGVETAIDAESQIITASKAQNQWAGHHRPLPLGLALLDILGTTMQQLVESHCMKTISTEMIMLKFFILNMIMMIMMILLITFRCVWISVRFRGYIRGRNTIYLYT